MWALTIYVTINFLCYITKLNILLKELPSYNTKWVSVLATQFLLFLIHKMECYMCWDRLQQCYRQIKNTFAHISRCWCCCSSWWSCGRYSGGSISGSWDSCVCGHLCAVEVTALLPKVMQVLYCIHHCTLHCEEHSCLLHTVLCMMVVTVRERQLFVVTHLMNSFSLH